MVIPEFLSAERVAAVVFAVALLAEFAHSRRIRRLAPLAFGRAYVKRKWTWVAAPLRVFCATVLAWCLFHLCVISQASGGDEAAEVPEEHVHQLLLVLDVSPSMHLKDAGPESVQSRAKRAAEVFSSMIERLDLRYFRFNLVAVYSDSRPVVEKCRDPEVIFNILNDLPLFLTFDNGKTRLDKGINNAFELCEDWQAGSATMIVLTDGDTIPEEGLKTPPPAIRDVLVVGIGKTSKGVFIDGHNSRQNQAVLRKVASRLGGAYTDANNKQVGSLVMDDLIELGREREEAHLGRREYCLIGSLVSALILALLPLLLDQFGARPRQGLQPLGGVA